MTEFRHFRKRLDWENDPIGADEEHRRLNARELIDGTTGTCISTSCIEGIKYAVGKGWEEWEPRETEFKDDSGWKPVKDINEI